jgi:hypothetical protein
MVFAVLRPLVSLTPLTTTLLAKLSVRLTLSDQLTRESRNRVLGIIVFNAEPITPEFPPGVIPPSTVPMHLLTVVVLVDRIPAWDIVPRSPQLVPDTWPHTLVTMPLV